MIQTHSVGGKGYRLQIDEPIFRGKRKFNRRRYKTGEKRKKDTVRDLLLA